MDLIRVDDRGLACQAGNFHVDPWGPAETAVITHAHADHARPGSGRYLCTEATAPILRQRLGPDVEIEPVPYGKRFPLGDVEVSFHPAGHVLGSAQVRVARDGEVWVVTGDYKRDPDPSCAAFEVVPCDVLITEATFALPIYRWPPASRVAEDILAWWDGNRTEGRTSLLFSYALGKAQRVLAELARITDRTVHLHGAVANVTELYRDAGVRMVPTAHVTDAVPKTELAKALVIAPPGASRSTWVRRFVKPSTAFASGWMQVRGARRRRGYDRGFVLSDHADWAGLLRTVHDTGATRVLTTHGGTAILARYLREVEGVESTPLETPYSDDAETAAEDAAPAVQVPE